MRRLSVSTLVKLDGVVQDSGGFGEIEDGGWAGPYFNDEAGLRDRVRGDVDALDRDGVPSAIGQARRELMVCIR